MHDAATQVMKLSPSYVSDNAGMRIAYFATGVGKEAVILANGLGGRVYTWQPLIELLAKRYRVITWDYRGLFDSQCPKNRRYLSVQHQADDMRMVLDCEDIERAHVCGWSMGVQVALEFACLYPERAQTMTLVNGTYGHAFTSALPLPSEWVHQAAEAVARSRWIPRILSRALPAIAGPVTRIFEHVTGARREVMRPLLERYAREVFNEQNFGNFVRLAQELDAQCAYHHLPDIKTPTLIVSGGLDPLTPARQSRRMAQRLPNAERLHLERASHFALLEQPDVVGQAIADFIKRHAHAAPQPSRHRLRAQATRLVRPALRRDV